MKISELRAPYRSPARPPAARRPASPTTRSKPSGQPGGIQPENGAGALRRARHHRGVEPEQQPGKRPHQHTAILDAGTSPDPRATRLQLSETVSERSVCSAPFDAVDRGDPFNAMSREAELALLASIKAVTRALANTSAVVALLAAVHDLVKSYAAGDT